MNNQFRSLLLSIIILCSITAHAQSYTIDGIIYEIISDKAVGVARQKSSYGDKWNIVIPPSVTIEGKQYVVEEIMKYAFSETTPSDFYGDLISITLPNTIKKIGKSAFHKSSLTQIHLPLGLEVIEDYAFDESDLRYVEFPPSLQKIGSSCFRESHSFSRQKGFHAGIQRTGEFPALCFYECPVMDEIEGEIYDTFSYNYVHKIYKLIQEWQRKKPFETMDQWRARVTEQNRKKKTEQFVNQLKTEFANNRGHSSISGSLGVYDEDYHVYAIETSYGTSYVQVQPSDREFFIKGWGKASITPTWCVRDDRLALESLSVKIKDRIFSTPPSVSEVVDENSFLMELPPLEIDLNDQQPSIALQPTALDKDLDENIPVSTTTSSNTFVVAIGCENYQLTSPVGFAENDMNIFTQYCRKTLGIPQQNIRKYKDATYGAMLSALNDLKAISEAFDGDLNVIFYYAGHGIPNEATQNAYLLPVDADGSQTEVCFPVSRLYSELHQLNAKSVVVFLDACFSGAKRGEGLLTSARGVAIEPKVNTVQGNLIVFSASSGSETAYPYMEKGHGLFTYYLLKKLQESKGDCTLGELFNYIQENVKRQSILTNRKSQTPTVISSQMMKENWMNLKLKR